MSNELKRYTVAVIDDQPSSIIALKGLLEISGQFRVLAFSGPKAVSKTIQHFTKHIDFIDTVDLFMIDLRINGSESGVTFVKWLLENSPESKWVIWTGCEESETFHFTKGRETTPDFDKHVLTKTNFVGMDLVDLIKHIINSEEDYPSKYIKEKYRLKSEKYKV